jgi:hypothetical protein
MLLEERSIFMPNPVEGKIFTTGSLRPLTFVQGFNSAGLVNTGKLTNLSTGNNFTYNNAQITTIDNNTGTLQISANLAETGEYLAQFRGEPANNATVLFSTVYSFRVVDPI